MALSIGGKAVAQKVRTACTPASRAKGLMFEHPSRFDYALVFERENETRFEASIHMCFVFFPIDVLWLNAQKKVVDMREGLPPWTPNATPKAPSKYIVELPAGTIAQKGIKPGQKADW